MIYLDNSATSYPKPRGMIEKMEQCILNYCGNPGRSGHYMSMKTGEEIYKARKNIARLINAGDTKNVVFTKNTTEALNIAIKGFLKEGDHVITTSMEHNSVLRPLKELERYGVSNSIVYGDEKGCIRARDIERAVRDNTSLIVCTHGANTTGTILPIKEIGKIARKHRCKFLVDGAQTGGALDIDVKALNIDMLAMAGHKGLLGPQGTGALYISPGCDLLPLMEGGTGTESKNQYHPRELPEAMEAGTLNSPSIIGLGYSVAYVDKIGPSVIGKYEEDLIRRLEEGLRNMDKITIFGPEDPARKTGVCLMNIEGMECEEVTSILNNQYGIQVRGGFHCAGLAHKTIGTWNKGAVRISVGLYNTKKEMDILINALWHLTKAKR